MTTMTVHGFEDSNIEELEEAYEELSEQFVTEMLETVVGRFDHLSEARRRVRVEEAINESFRDAIYAIAKDAADRVFSRDYPEWDEAVEHVQQYADDLRSRVLEEARSL